MSEVVEKFSLPSACKYNSKCSYDLPDEVIAAYPDLAEPRSSEKFVWAVRNLQTALSLIADGKLGWQTYSALLAHYTPLDEEYVVMQGRRLHIPKSDLYDLITFDEPNGLDLHRFGNFSHRSKAPSSLCLHWGGLDPKHCYNVFASNSRQVSSHFLIGLVDGRPTVYQVLDMQHKAWHGGWVNDDSIGIDVCQSPMKQWLDHYTDQSYNVEVVDNDTGRGPKKVISLDPRIADAAHAFVMDLLDVLGWDFVCPVDHSVTKDISDLTVFGHHHVNERKYDIAPWWAPIFEVDEAEEAEDELV